MPAISIDTFFACSLMVIVVVSAMAGTSKILYPQINSNTDEDLLERCREFSKYLLMSSGEPPQWGQLSDSTPETFGLAQADSGFLCDLDIDKVTRLNSENLYAISYSEIFSSLRMSDLSFRLEIRPIFEVSVDLTSTFESATFNIYSLGISTEKNGVSVQTVLKCYVFAEDYFETYLAGALDGATEINVVIPNESSGPALVVVFAKSVYNPAAISYAIYKIAHNSGEPVPRGTFLELSPLNHTLNVGLNYPSTILSEAYALTFNYNSTIEMISNSSQSATFEIPFLSDSSPILTVVTGRNMTDYFNEWTVYPQIPVQIGASFEGLMTRSNIFAFTYLVTVDLALYECTIWVGGSSN